jgi:hypothetical protein
VELVVQLCSEVVEGVVNMCLVEVEEDSLPMVVEEVVVRRLTEVVAGEEHHSY